MRGALWALVVLGTLPFVQAWVTTAQARLGVSLEDIARMMHGQPRPVDLHPQVELSMLWTHNPEGLPYAAGTEEWRREQLRGLGGGITWAWDPTLCDDLVPLFREAAVVYGDLVNCEGIQAAVKRAYSRAGPRTRGRARTQLSPVLATLAHQSRRRALPMCEDSPSGSRIVVSSRWST